MDDLLASIIEKVKQTASSLGKDISKVPSLTLNSAKKIGSQAISTSYSAGKGLSRGLQSALIDSPLNQSMTNTDLSEANKNLQLAIKLKKTNPYMSQRLFQRAQTLSQNASKRNQIINETLQKGKEETTSNLIKTGINTLGIPTAIQNPIGTITGGFVGGEINKLTGGKFDEGYKKGIETGVKFSAISPLTNPLISGLSGKVKTLVENPVARQIVGRTLSGLGSVAENEILAKLEKQKITTSDRLISFGIGSILSSGGKPEDWDKLKKDTKDLIVDGGKIFGLDTRTHGEVWVLDKNMADYKYRNMPEFMVNALDKVKKGNYPMGFSVQQTNDELTKNVSQAVKSGEITTEEGQAILGTLEETSKVKLKAKNIKQDVQDILTGTESKTKRLVARMQASDKYSDELNAALTGQYVPQTDKEISNFAKQAIFNDFDTAEARALNPTSAVDMEIGSQLFGKYMEAGNVDKANAILNATSGTNEGQMIHILANYDKTSPEGSLRLANKLVNEYNKVHTDTPITIDNKRIQDIYNQAKEIQGMKVGRERNIASQELIDEINSFIPSSITDKAITVWKAGLLTSLRTTERNLLGNTIMEGSEIVKDVPASFIDRMLSFKTGQRTLTATTKGLGEGSQQGFQQAKDMVTLGYDPSDDIQKFDVKKINWGDNPIEQTLKKYTDTVFNVLAGEDRPFWQSAYARSLYDQAGSEAVNAGKSGDSEYIANLVKNATARMKANATTDANYATFHDKNSINKAANAIKQALSKNELTKLGSEFIMPFTGVPSSIVGKAIDYSPVGLVKGAIKAGKVLISDSNIASLQRQASQDLGRGIVGTALLTLGAYLTQNGLMTGNPKDTSESNQWQLEGKQPNSILIGGKWRSINSIGPQAIVMLAGAKAQENLGKEGGAGKFIGDIGKDFLNQTFLSGVQGLTNAVSDPTRYAQTYLQSEVSSFIPNIIKDTAKAFDSTARETNSITDSIKSGIPGLRNTLTPKRDVLGNEIPQEPTGIGGFIDLFNSKTPISNIVTNELSRLNNVGVNATPSKLSKEQTIKGSKVNLTPSQLDYLEQAVGEKLSASLETLFNSSSYQQLTDEEKETSISNLTSKIRKQVKNTIDLSAENIDKGYVHSKDAPQGIIQTVGIYGKSLITDPGQTIKAVLAGNPIRKVEGGAVILERKQGLSALDKGNTSTQVDHKIALTLGGTNDDSNLQTLTNAENKVKGQVETYLYNEMKAGRITKKEAQQRDLNWKNEIDNLPMATKQKLVNELSTDTTSSKMSGNIYATTNKDGNVTTIDTSKVSSMPETTNYEKILKEKKAYSYVDNILDSDLSTEDQAKALSELGISSEDATYYNVARQSDDIKYAYVQDELSKYTDRSELLKALVNMRKEVNGKMVLSNSVIDDLNEVGVISDDEKTQLKAITIKNGTVKVKTTGRGKKVSLKSISSKENNIKLTAKIPTLKTFTLRSKESSKTMTTKGKPIKVSLKAKRYTVPTTSTNYLSGLNSLSSGKKLRVK